MRFTPTPIHHHRGLRPNPYIDARSPSSSASRKEIFGELPTRRALGSGGRFQKVGLNPEDAWLGALVNAMVHRSYSISGDHVRFEIFDDRIEVESPWAVPGHR